MASAVLRTHLENSPTERIWRLLGHFLCPQPASPTKLPSKFPWDRPLWFAQHLMKLLRSNPFKWLPPLLAAWKLKHCAVIRFLLDSSLHSVLHTARAQGAVSMEGGIRKQRVLTSAPGPKVNGWAAPQQDEVNHSQESNPFSRLTVLGFGCLHQKWLCGQAGQEA